MPLLASQTEQLAEIVGAANVSVDPATLAGFEVDGVCPATLISPASREEIAAVVRYARESKLRLMPVGGGTRLGLGGIPAALDVALSLARLNRVVDYEPADLTVSVQAGARLADFQKTLSAHHQFLPLDPPYAREGTLGGILATNASGSKRFAYGSARDFTLGMVCVTGAGKVVKTGGRVVKNVAGYDLGKLLIGSYGTLGIITEIHFKVFPLPRASATLLSWFDHLEKALAMRSAILHSRLGPVAIDLLDAQAAQIVGGSLPQLSPSGCSLLVTVGGVERVITRCVSELSRMAEECQAIAFAAIAEDEEAKVLGRVQEFVQALREYALGLTMIKAALPLAQLGPFLERAQEIAGRYEFASAIVARAGNGLAYFSLLANDTAEATCARLTQAATEMIHLGTSLGGRVTLLWCPTAVKRDVNVWGPAGEDLALMHKLKAAFDPDRVLNPGRFLGGL